MKKPLTKKEKAQKNFEKALEIRKKIFPPDNPARKRSEKNLIRMRWKVK